MPCAHLQNPTIQTSSAKLSPLWKPWKYFHCFVAGRHFTTRTYHAPLRFRFIFNSSAHSERVPFKLQRWAIILKAYNYTIQYVKGEGMLLVDTLSRLPLAHNVTKVSVIDMVQVNILSEFTDCDSLLQEIASFHDADISLLKRCITDGWLRRVPTKLFAIFKGASKIHYSSGNRVLWLLRRSSKCLRHRIMNILHRDDPGIVRMMRLARQYFWWPNTDSSIESFVQRWETCQLNVRKTH